MIADDKPYKSVGKRIQSERKAHGLTQEELSRKAEVPYTTLTKIESGYIKNPSLKAIAKLAVTLGISIDDVAMVQTYEGEKSVTMIWKDVLTTLKPGDEMFISGVDEKIFFRNYKKELGKFIKEIGVRGISQKILACEGDIKLLKEDHVQYRWLPKKFFNPTPIYAYGSKVAMLLWGPPQQVIILGNTHLADAYSKQFQFMWEHAIKIDEP